MKKNTVKSASNDSHTFLNTQRIAQGINSEFCLFEASSFVLQLWFTGVSSENKNALLDLFLAANSHCLLFILQH